MAFEPKEKAGKAYDHLEARAQELPPAGAAFSAPFSRSPCAM